MSTEISIEFFPPTTTEGADKLRATCEKLAALKPAFFSVTYGAGGSTRERTFSTVKVFIAYTIFLYQKWQGPSTETP